MNNYYPIGEYGFTNSIQSLREDISILKMKIFKALTMQNQMDIRDINMFLAKINNYLKFWETNAEDLSEAMSRSKGVEEVRALSYDVVKDYLYAKYDYAAILQFTDGVIKGINSEEFTKSEDIDDFFKFTINKAFQETGKDAAEMIDTVLMLDSKDMKYIITDKLEARKYDSIKNNNLFSDNDRSEIYKSIEKTINFLTSDNSLRQHFNQTKLKLYISVVNNVIEFMMCTLAAYACRIYFIGRYAESFIERIGKDHKEADNYDESVSEDLNDTPPRTNLGVQVWHDCEEIEVRNPDYCNKLIDLIDEFCMLIGVEWENGRAPECSYQVNRNLFSSALLGNPLYNKLEHCWIPSANQPAFDKSIAEFNSILKNATNVLNVTGEYTDKDEILHVIRATTKGKTLKDIRDLAKEFAIFARALLRRTSDVIATYQRAIQDSKGIASISSLNILHNNLQMTTELYRDFATAIMLKGRDLELKYNTLNHIEYDAVLNKLKFNFPAGNKTDEVETTINMMVGVPDTLRGPANVVSDLYSLPVFESFLMYNEFMKDVYHDDEYMIEAFDWKTFIDRIQAFWEGLVNKVRNFILNKQYQAAVKWVTDHEQELLKLQFQNTDKMQVYNFKENISIPKGWLENFNKALTTYDPSKGLDEKLLYPDGVYEWFANPNGLKEATNKWNNYFLFTDNPASTTADPIKPVEIKGQQIQQYLKTWVAAVKGSNDLIKGIDQIQKSVSNALKTVKGKIGTAPPKTESVEIEETTTEAITESIDYSSIDILDVPIFEADANNNAPEISTAPANTGDNKQQNQSKPADKNTQAASQGNGTVGSTNSSDTRSKDITAINNVITKLLGPMLHNMIYYQGRVYAWLTGAYSLGNKTNEPQQPATPENPQ